MKNSWTGFVYFAVLAGFLLPVFAQQAVPVIDVQARCQDEEKYECHGACFDGWGTACYLDGDPLENNVSLASQQEKCYAFYDMSVCAPCRNVYEIEGKSVTCAEFYGAINEKNQKCGGCLKYIFSGGG